MSFILETERLALREFTLDDVDLLHSITGDPVAMKYYPKVYSQEEAQEKIEKQISRYKEFGYGSWACFRKSDGEFVGACGLLPQEVEREWKMEVGYMFRVKHWHQGYATEAARACRDFGFQNHPVEYIISLIRPVNEPSQKVAQRNGMTYWKDTIFHDLLHGVWKITREEWEKIEHNNIKK